MTSHHVSNTHETKCPHLHNVLYHVKVGLLMEVSVSCPASTVASRQTNNYQRSSIQAVQLARTTERHLLNVTY